MKPAILIARALLPAGLDLIAEVGEIRVGGLAATREDLLGLAPGATAIVADPTVPVDAELLDAAGETLRIVANFAVGYDNVDLDACRERGVAVTEHARRAHRRHRGARARRDPRGRPRDGELERKLREGRWTGWDPGADLGTELSGATFAVVGLGRIGRRYAELVRPLAGRLLYVAPHAEARRRGELDAERAELSEALAAADVVSLHAPGGEATRHLIGAPELAAMKTGAILVNTSRGTLVDSVALAAALESGAIAAAGLDVYEDEPRVADELLEAPNAILLPHVGSATRRARDAMAATVAANVLAVLSDAEPPNRVA